MPIFSGEKFFPAVAPSLWAAPRVRGAAVGGDGGDGEEAEELRHGRVLEVRQPCGEPTEGGMVGCGVGNEAVC